MSYTVLARRYRSGTFDEVIGQEHVAQTLKRAIETGRIAHAYLFCGTRGTGKTSMARILAKALNCQAFDAPTPNPCGKCNSCLAIARGDDMSVLEIDAASNTGVDSIREVIENAYNGAPGRYKVYIIDEVHMLSKSAFNALLKTLEEPPAHVKFILATTEPEKVLPTILSRCQRYDFRNIPTREIADHLKNISKQEKIKADDDALMLVAKAGAGSMRDALSLLDRLLSMGEKTLTAEMIEQMLGMPRAQVIFDLAGAIGAGDVKQTLEIAGKLISGGLSGEALAAALIDQLRNLLILRACGPSSDLVELPGLSSDDLQAQAAKFDPVALSQDIALLEELRRSLRSSQAGRALLDATLVRLALAEQFTNINGLLNGENAPATAAQRAASSAPALKKKLADPIAPIVEREAPASKNNPDEDDDDALPAPGKVWDTSGPSLSELLKQQERLGAPAEQPSIEMKTDANVEAVDPNDFDGVMSRLRGAVHARSPGIDGFLSHGRYIGINDGVAVIALTDGAAMTMLDRGGKRQIIQDELSRVLNETVGVKFEIDHAGAATEAKSSPTSPVVRREIPRPREAPTSNGPIEKPAIRITAELREQIRAAEPLVAMIMDELGGEIVKVE